MSSAVDAQELEQIKDIIDMNMRILVVDDSSTMRRIISSTLKELGMRNIVTAEDGDEAWEKVKRDNFDLILSDHKMPRMSGEELLRHVRSSEEHKCLPFIMITAESFQENVIAAVKLGVSNYIVKPFSAKQLLEKLIKVFGAGRL